MNDTHEPCPGCGRLLLSKYGAAERLRDLATYPSPYHLSESDDFVISEIRRDLFRLADELVCPMGCAAPARSVAA